MLNLAWQRSLFCRTTDQIQSFSCFWRWTSCSEAGLCDLDENKHSVKLQRRTFKLSYWLSTVVVCWLLECMTPAHAQPDSQDNGRFYITELTFLRNVVKSSEFVNLLKKGLRQISTCSSLNLSPGPVQVYVHTPSCTHHFITTTSDYGVYVYHRLYVVSLQPSAFLEW